MLQFKQRQSHTEEPPPRWNLGVDRRRVAVYVAGALIAGFSVGVLTYRFIVRREAAPASSAVESRAPERQPTSDTLAGQFHRVTRILRADTIEVEGVGPVRLIGIETPDGKSPREIYGAHGDRALRFAEKTLVGQEVRVEYDSAADRDGSGQLIAYVYTRDGVLINAEMVKQGLAFVRGAEEFRLANDFLGYEREALLSMRGVWGSSSTSPISSAASAPADSSTSTDDKSKKLSPLSPSALGPNVPALSSSGSAHLEQTVWVSPADKMYHKSTCEYLDKKKHLIAISQAKSEGYTACSRCFASTVLKAP